jgi:hypothetical protein
MMVILGLLVACSSQSSPSRVRPSDIVSSTLEIGDVTWVSGSLVAYWLSVLPAAGESCEESRWLAIHTDAYGDEDGEVRPRVELAVPPGFESGAPASIPTVPLDPPLEYPGFEIFDAATDAYSAFSGGAASWFDSGTGTLTFSLTGSELCDYDLDEHAFTECAETEATLTMVGAVFRSGACYEGVSGSQLSPAGTALCVFEGYRLPADPVDCEENESTAP